MEPITALGAAAAIVQLLDVGLGLMRGAYEGLDGIKHANEDAISLHKGRLMMIPFLGEASPC